MYRIPQEPAGQVCLHPGRVEQFDLFSSSVKAKAGGVTPVKIIQITQAVKVKRYIV